MSTPRITPVRVLLNFGRKDAKVLETGEAVYTGFNGNTDYPAPPVEPAQLKTELTGYSAAITAALDGGRKAIAFRNAQREIVLRSLRKLAFYAESNCNDDINVFLSTGFQPVSRVRGTPGQVPPSTIRKVEQGVTGQLLITIKGDAKVLTHELQQAVVAADGTTGPWTRQAVPFTKNAFPWNGLAPGTLYAFQVRALGRRGFSDWSNSFTKMCG